MAYDCRLLSDFYSHLKTIRLLREYGGDGVVALQRLWCYATEYRPSGVFVGMDKTDLADVTYLVEEDRDFIDYLVKIGFLDLDEQRGEYSLHNWEKRNPYVANRAKISAQKSAAAHARHAKTRQKKARADAKKSQRPQAVGDDGTGCNADAMQMQCPNPSQPNPKKTKDTLSQSLSSTGRGERERELFAALVQEAMPGGSLKRPEAWVAMLADMVEAGHALDALAQVMRWALRDGFWASRVLSAKAFADNYHTLAMQCRQSAAATCGTGVAAQGEGCSAEEWAERKRQQREGVQKGAAEESSQPP